MKTAIVDDDPIVCSSLSTILEQTHAADVLWTALAGDDAVSRYFSEPSAHPDVLLMDIQMPGMDGLRAAKAILARDPSARILFLTTFADDQYIGEAVGLGAKGYLIKQDVASVGPALQAVMAGQIVLGAEVLRTLSQSKAAYGGSDASVGGARHTSAYSSTSPSGGARRHTDRDSISMGRSPAGSSTPAAGHARVDDVAQRLSERERDIARLVALGLDNKDIAGRLFLSEGTIRNRISGILDKLGMTNRTQLAVAWINARG